MVLRSETDYRGVPLRIWQDANGWCVFQVGDCFFPAKANEHADLVLPHRLLVAPDLETARRIIEQGYRADR